MFYVFTKKITLKHFYQEKYKQISFAYLCTHVHYYQSDHKNIVYGLKDCVLHPRLLMKLWL